MSRSGSHRNAALVTREEGRRRALLLGIGALLLLSVGPVFGHHFASELEHGLRGEDHLGPICLIAMHEILAPVHYLFHAIVVGGLLYATWDRVRAARAVRRTLAPLEAVVPLKDSTFSVAAEAAGIDASRVRVITGSPNPAFTVGWLRPAIYVDASLVERLSLDEVAALLAHEGAHAARRDPLRLSLLRFLACTLFWLPALRRLAADIADEAEVQADDQAARERPLALASAILKIAGWTPAPDLPPASAVGFAHQRHLLDRRIRRLAGEDPSPVSHVTRRSIAGALFALAMVWSSGTIMAHPLPTEGVSHHLVHCEHPGESSLVHLFCFSNAFRTAADVCPHTRVALE